MNRIVVLLATCVLGSGLQAVASGDSVECATVDARRGWIDRQAAPAGAKLIRYEALSLDEARDVLVLFGGFNSWQYGTWEWNGSAWNEIESANEPDRWAHAMVYDRGRGASVIFGGRGLPGFSGPLLGDSWSWNGVSWAPIATVSAPPKRWLHAMAYDSRRRVTVMFGGAGSTNPAASTLGDTWELGETTWTEVGQGVSPSARTGHAMAYDSTRGVTFLFGGANGTTVFDDLWEWNGTRWHKVGGGRGPAPRSGAGLAYDAGRGVLVLFGGSDLFSQLYGDTWEWNGTAWTETTLSPKLDPHPRAGHSMVYDRRRGKILLYGADEAPGNSSVQRGPWEYSPNPLGARVIHDETTGGDLDGQLGPLSPGSNHVLGLVEPGDWFDNIEFSVRLEHRLDRIVVTGFQPLVIPEALFVELRPAGDWQILASAFVGVGTGGMASGVGADVLRGLPAMPGPLPAGAYVLLLDGLRSPEVDDAEIFPGWWGVDLQVVPAP